jgi:hypothetical protein|tara:strand:+ start:1080 stop:1571 length:492 start_codon:yes stop_codon:yes gene_type:complete
MQRDSTFLTSMLVDNLDPQNRHIATAESGVNESSKTGKRGLKNLPQKGSSRTQAKQDEQTIHGSTQEQNFAQNVIAQESHEADQVKVHLQEQSDQQLAVYDSNQYMMNNYLQDKSGHSTHGLHALDKPTGINSQQDFDHYNSSAFNDQVQFLIKKGELEVHSK